MTLQELYQNINGDYEQAIRVLRMDKLVDKHIRKLTQNGVVDKLIDAATRMDPTEMFETAHAMKGVCANLGLTRLSEAVSELAEEYRPGKDRRFTDGQVKEKIGRIEALYKQTAEAIQAYVNA